MTNNVSGAYSYSSVIKLTDTQLKQVLEVASDQAMKDKITASAVDGFTYDEIVALGDVDVNVGIKIMTLGKFEDTDETDKTTSSNTTTNTTTDKKDVSPTDIDPVGTAAFRAEVKLAKSKYDNEKDAADSIGKEIESRQDKMEEAQAALEKAVEKLSSKSEDISKNVNASMQSIIKKAQNGELTQAEAKEKLGAIKVPGLTSELGKVDGLEDEIDSLASTLTSLSNAYQLKAASADDIAKKYGNLLDTDLNTVSVNYAGQVVINQIGTGGPTESGAEGISATDMAKFAAMTTDELTDALKNTDAGKAIVAAMNEAGKDSGQTLTAEDCASIVQDLIKTNSTENKDSSAKAAFGTVGAAGILNTVNGVDKEAMNAAAKKVCDSKAQESSNKCKDPYVVTIDGKTYQFMKENGDGKWDTADIYGINDTKDNTFASMKEADIDGNGSVSAAELSKMGIRLVEVDNGKLQVNDSGKDFDLSKIDSINLNTLRDSNENNGETGTFGNFDLNLKDGRTIVGEQTFEEKSTLEKMFDGVKNFFSGLANAVINRFKLDPDTVKLYSGAGVGAMQDAKAIKKDVKGVVEAASSNVDSTSKVLSDAEGAGYGVDEKKQSASQAKQQEEVQVQQKQEVQKKKKLEEV
ncbi:MAG: hypothetical protein PHV37_02025 [Candidatus Gastranaerophilales bacterium]|nr:hypothetical protein [Candidatus Gastranaerophilales bacterium]